MEDGDGQTKDSDGSDLQFIEINRMEKLKKVKI
jgi:hypothetical protein